MKYLEGVTKDLEKAGIQVGSSEPPRYWFSTGNYVLNRIVSGNFHKGVPQGRLMAFAGPSGAGKSFLAANAMKSAQADGAHIVVLDSENALDDDFVSAVGVDVTTNYTYVAIDTIPQTKKIVSAVIQGYKAEYGHDAANAPKLLIVIDSLDMLITETELEHFSKGVSKGDQGQRNKQLKAMLREFVQAVKRHNISMIVTSQVYRNQDVTNGEGVWVVSDAVKYSLSQIVLLTKLKLKDKDSREVQGIRMKTEGYKTRFTKPYQVVTIEVPYDTGMDPFNGMLEAAVEMGLVVKKGSRYAIAGEDKTWYATTFADYQDQVLAAAETKRDHFLAVVDDNSEEVDPDKSSVKKQRLDLLTEKIK